MAVTLYVYGKRRETFPVRQLEKNEFRRTWSSSEMRQEKNEDEKEEKERGKTNHWIKHLVLMLMTSIS